VSNGSVEIPDLISLPKIHDEPVFDEYRMGGCRVGGGEAPKERYKKRSFLQSLSNPISKFKGFLIGSEAIYGYIHYWLR
jgi:hypothetical protein